MNFKDAIDIRGPVSNNSADLQPLGGKVGLKCVQNKLTCHDSTGGVGGSA